MPCTKPLLVLKPSLVVPIAAANNSSVREKKASKSGSFAKFFLKILIAVRSVMGGSFFPAIAIDITVNSITTTKKSSSHIGPLRGTITERMFRYGTVFELFSN